MAMKITSHYFCEELAKAGIISGDLSTISRVTIDARGGQPLVINIEQSGDTRIFDTIPALKDCLSPEGDPS